MLIKKDLILDKIATTVKKIQDAVLTISNCYTKKIHKKILSNTTNYNFCCDYGCNCSNLTSYKKKLQHIQKHYCYDCLTGCNSRNREIATPVIQRLITMKSIKKPCVLRRLQTSAVIIVATPAINRLQKQKCDRKLQHLQQTFLV
jgi:hypothetical protein